ncbi:allantoate amidohydrolase [Pseudonocardia sp. HH130630-07]|uniref:allantoate amidohydrolase n=1 Tax=Pseudonocardia sp. HH130630-07 TaxID=1690815 RepID=UPI000814C21C|nr:allantoate amidohydrolase [Pseudonocardia sp. HH130630-07]ANY09360.1 Zn-dependent hydrolase [Pseudonocardia sp. HH130630-07]
MSTFDGLWAEIAGVGRDPGSGGYRRPVWGAAERTLREWFLGCAAGRGMDTETDRNGNLWAWWLPPGRTGDPSDALVTGSHLDSVPDGGAFDGPLGVVSAFAAVDALRAEGHVPRRPIGIVAFADEEGARFGVACAGSQLSTGALAPERALGLRDAEGHSLAEVLTAAGRDPSAVGRDPRLTERVGLFVELHVEQGRALDRLGEPVAVASSIWPHGRWRLDFTGEANHAGATLLADRHDPMLPYAATVVAARERAGQHGGVATFGKLGVTPNGANAIASAISAVLDARAPSTEVLEAMTAEVFADAARHAATEGTTVAVRTESVSPVVTFPDGPRDRIRRVLGAVPVLPTAAGHDAGVLSAVLPTAMLFVRNPTGVSHSPAEWAEHDDCLAGVAALTAVLRDGTSA